MEDAKVFNEKDFSRQLRPAWTPFNIMLMVLFFITGLWFLGLAMIAYMLYGKQLGIDFSNFNKTKSTMRSTFDKAPWTSEPSSTGNAAFDEWRRAEMERLEEERRRLDEARREFDDYLRELRRARDEEEFRAFRQEWSRRKDSTDQREQGTPSTEDFPSDIQRGGAGSTA